MSKQKNPCPRLIPLALILGAACTLGADPLSKKTEIDFYRDVPSRDMHGLASRSDGPAGVTGIGEVRRRRFRR